MIKKEIVYCGRQLVLACDGRCDKAWGNNGRPRHRFDSDDEDDYVYIGDADLGAAPPPGCTNIVTEGDHVKPSADAHERPELLNKWCARECERSVMALVGEPVALPDMSAPAPNKFHRRSP